MGKKNRRKNNPPSSKANQTVQIEQVNTNQSISNLSALPQKDEIIFQGGKSSQLEEACYLNGVSIMKACFTQNHSFNQRKSSQDQGGECQECEDILEEANFQQHEEMQNDSHKNQVALSRLNEERRNQINKYESAQIQKEQAQARNHHSQQINGKQLVENGFDNCTRTNNMMVRRIERKEPSKSWDAAFKRNHHQNNYSGEDEEDEQEYEEKYEDQHNTDKNLFYHSSQQQHSIQSNLLPKFQENKFQHFYSNSRTAYTEDRESQDQEIKEDDDDDDDDDKQHLDEYDDEVEEEEEEDDEEEVHENGNFPYHQNLKVQYMKTPYDNYPQRPIIKNSKVFNKQLQQSQVGGIHAYQIQQLQKQQIQIKAQQLQMIQAQNPKNLMKLTVERGEEDDEEEEEEYEQEEEYAQQLEHTYLGVHPFQEDDMKSHMRPLDNNQINYFQQNKIQNSQQEFIYGPPQISILQKQILYRQQQQQLQQMQQKQQKIGKQIQKLSPQIQQQLNQQQLLQQQQQQQLQMQSPNQFKNNVQQQNSKAGYKLDALQQKQENIIHSRTPNNNYYSNGQSALIQKGCKTPSTDDNSECFNGYSVFNGSTSIPNSGDAFLKNKKNFTDQGKSSNERATPPKQKSESEKKHYSPSSYFQHQNYHSEPLHHQNYLTKFKYCKQSDFKRKERSRKQNFKNMNDLRNLLSFSVKDKHLDLDQILKKIYFEEYSYDNLKEFVFPALREVPDINQFFDILFNSIRLYAEEVKNQIHQQLKEIIMCCQQEESDKKQQKEANKVQDISYFESILNRNFKDLQKPFLDITNYIYNQYSVIEDNSKQTEKIVHLYISHFIEKNKSIRFNCTDLHKRIFVFFVFNDIAISNYLEAMFNFFKQKIISGNQFDQCFSQLSDIHNILTQKSHYIPSEEHPINIEIYEKETCDEEDEDEDSSDERSQQAQALQNAVYNQKILKKKKKNKSSNAKKLAEQKLQIILEGEMTGEQQDLYYEQVCGNEQLQNIEITENMESVEGHKKKKKKKKKSKNGTTQENEIEEEEIHLDNSSAEKPKKDKNKGQGCPMNEELEQFTKRLEESFRNLKEQQKILPIISDQWILKLKDKYAKLKTYLNK